MILLWGLTQREGQYSESKTVFRGAAESQLNGLILRVGHERWVPETSPFASP